MRRKHIVVVMIMAFVLVMPVAIIVVHDSYLDHRIATLRQRAETLATVAATDRATISALVYERSLALMKVEKEIESKAAQLAAHQTIMQRYHSPLDALYMQLSMHEALINDIESTISVLANSYLWKFPAANQP